MAIRKETWTELLNGIFNSGFENDKTPLDERTLNQVLRGILLVKDSGDTTNENLIRVIRVLWGNSGIPTVDNPNIPSIETQLSTNSDNISGEVARREAFERYITGEDDINTKTLDEEYDNSNTKLRADLDDEASSRADYDKAIIQSLFGEDEIPDEFSTTNSLLTLIKDISKATFGQESTPTGGDSLQEQIDSLLGDADKSEVTDKSIYGLSKKMDQLIDDIRNTINGIIVEGMGVPQSVIDGTNTNWNGEYDGWTFEQGE